MSRKRVEKNISYDDEKNIYYVNFNYGVVEGKQVKRTKTFKKLTEARKVLKEFEGDKIKGQTVIPKQITVSDWMDDFYNNIVIPNNAKTTIYSYANIIRKIKSILGTKKLQELKPSDIQNYYTKMLISGLSGNTVRKHFDLLNKALKLAVKQDVIVNNPNEKTEPPKKTKKEIGHYDIEQTKKLLTIIKSYNDPNLELIINLGVFCGLRRGEIMGLKWKKVDFDKKILYIKETRTQAGQIIEKETKTKESQRKIAIPDVVNDLLVKEKAKQSVDKIKTKAYADYGYVIVWKTGEPIRPNYISELVTKIIKDNDLPKLTLHGTRHTFASIANEAGLTLFDISKILGHSKIGTTADTYTHTFENSKKDKIDAVANMIIDKS